LIFVTIGNATQGFHRLLEAVDRLAGRGFFIGESVLIQAGNARDFSSMHCQQADFLGMTEFVETIRLANVVICHAGAGTLFHCFQAGKVPVVMPRRKEYGEHVDDHQVELAEALQQDGRAILVCDAADLANGILEAKQRNTEQLLPSSSRMLSLVAQAIEDLKNRER